METTPELTGSFEADSAMVSAYLTQGGDEAELNEARIEFLRRHADDVYAALTDDLRRPVRDEELVYAAAERFPGLTPTRAQMADERERALADKHGIEIAQGL